jgi:polyhydroxyalkanoate synthesis regulator protein
VQGLVPRYLEQALAAFGHQQEQMRTAMQKSMGNFFAFGNMEEVGRQNMAMMERALSLFTPFYRPGDPIPGSEGAAPQGIGFDPTQEVAALRAEIEVLRQELAEARGGRKPAPVAEESPVSVVPPAKTDPA